MDPQTFSSHVAEFSAKFCNELQKNKNVVSSPLSAQYVLAILALGSTDPAQSELLKSMGFQSEKQILEAFSEVSSKIKSIKGVTLNVANKLYLYQGPHKLNAQLQDHAVKIFDAGMEQVNFANSGAVTRQINSWVESQTNHRIKDLLSSDSVNQDTRLVLVNALYFKGTWKKQFDRKNTLDRTFHVTSSQTKNIPMMFVNDKFRYGESKELQAQLLEMSYEGEEANMLIVLPKEVEGLNGVLKKLANGHNLISDIENMVTTKVEVSLPKFKIETEIDLKDVLPKLGINAIFHPLNSGLTKLLDSDEPLCVSKAVQKAFIEVNEEGAEAAAATGAVVMMRAMIMTLQFIADRPFLYVLYGPNWTTLFLGNFHGNE